MSIRVLSTDTAKQSIAHMRAIVSGGLADQVAQLKRQGDVLSDPNVWDGALAARFRGSVWPETEAALRRLLDALAELQRDVDTITTNIMAAGS